MSVLQNVQGVQERTKNEVILRDLAVTDFLVQRVVTIVDVCEDAQLREFVRNFGRIFLLGDE